MNRHQPAWSPLAWFYLDISLFYCYVNNTLINNFLSYLSFITLPSDTKSNIIHNHYLYNYLSLFRFIFTIQSITYFFTKSHPLFFLCNIHKAPKRSQSIVKYELRDYWIGIPLAQWSGACSPCFRGPWFESRPVHAPHQLTCCSPLKWCASNSQANSGSIPTRLVYIRHCVTGSLLLCRKYKPAITM